MQNSLEKIDSLYKETIKQLPKTERLNYCKTLINLAQVSLSRNKRLTNEKWEDQLFQIIFAAQVEIARINDEKQ